MHHVSSQSSYTDVELHLSVFAEVSHDALLRQSDFWYPLRWNCSLPSSPTHWSKRSRFCPVTLAHDFNMSMLFAMSRTCKWEMIFSGRLFNSSKMLSNCCMTSRCITSVPSWSSWGCDEYTTSHTKSQPFPPQRLRDLLQPNMFPSLQQQVRRKHGSALRLPSLAINHFSVPLS